MSEEKASLHFIEHIIEEDLANGFDQNQIRFSFPQNLMVYLHVGHLKAIALNFNLGKRYNAPVNLRFDDTNPVKENQVFVDAIKENIEWLGYHGTKNVMPQITFEQLYQWAVFLIKEGKLISIHKILHHCRQKGTPTQAGVNSPFRDRPLEENLALFEEMKAGKHPEGSHVLRAKIDMASPNMLMRDPVCTAFSSRTITELAMLGAFILCTIGHTVNQTI